MAKIETGCGMNGAAERVPEVVVWVDSLGAAVNRLIDAVTTLEVRLGNVLGPEPPADVCSEAPVAASCELAVRVQTSAVVVSAVEARIYNIIRRLEV